jgi:protein-S-isoprenylcysteine O-methyltransferase Ste14
VLHDLKEDRTRLTRDGVRGITREVILTLVHFAVLLISAGEIYWINAWLCIGLGLSYHIINTIFLLKINPQMLNERGKLIQENTKHFDKLFIALYIPLSLMVSIVAGLDAVRYGWSSIPSGVTALGVVLFILASILGSWAMAVNPHFELTVRIQDDRDQRVCMSGPYRIIRHPGYAAWIIGATSYPLILGSWWALLSVAAPAILFVIRTALEDRTLREGLAGYEEYTRITRYRLIPFVW